MRSKHIIFVHGLFGWSDPDPLEKVLPHWGDAAQQFAGSPLAPHRVKCGPISSFHDRACEVFAAIKGTRVDYGAEHSKTHGHDQIPTAPGKDFMGKGILPEWSKDNPIILVGHSAGAQTCLKLQQLLEQDFWGLKSDANWVEAVVCVSGVLNGSTLPYMPGLCDERTGRLRPNAALVFEVGMNLLTSASNLLNLGGLKDPIDPFLDQWSIDPKAGAEKIKTSPEWARFTQGEDNLAFDLSLQGCLKANQPDHGLPVTFPNSYYFSLVSRWPSSAAFKSKFTRLMSRGWQFVTGANSLNPILTPSELFQANMSDFGSPPISGWGSADLVLDKWRENDGAVSEISQRYPFTAKPQPIGGEGVFGRAAGTPFAPGQWYWEHIDAAMGESFDHLDPVFGSRLKPPRLRAEHQQLYQKLRTLLT